MKTESELNRAGHTIQKTGDWDPGEGTPPRPSPSVTQTPARSPKRTDLYPATDGFVSKPGDGGAAWFQQLSVSIVLSKPGRACATLFRSACRPRPQKSAKRTVNL